MSAHVTSPDGWQVEDLATCRFETETRVALVNIGWGHGPGDAVVIGTDGRIEIRYEEGGTPPWANLEHVRVTTAAGTREVMGPATERRIGLGDFPSHTVAFRALATAFAEAAHGRGRPVATGADGLRILECVVGAYLSAGTGATVGIPLDRSSPPVPARSDGCPRARRPCRGRPTPGPASSAPTTRRVRRREDRPRHRLARAPAVRADARHRRRARHPGHRAEHVELVERCALRPRRVARFRAATPGPARRGHVAWPRAVRAQRQRQPAPPGRRRAPVAEPVRHGHPRRPARRPDGGVHVGAAGRRARAT